MSERDGYDHGVPTWITGAHPDPARAAGFLTAELLVLARPADAGRYFSCAGC